MNNPVAPLTDKLSAIFEGFFYVLPNIGIGLVVFGLFIIAAWAAQRSISGVLGTRDRTDLGVLLGGFAKWALLLFGVLVAATIIFPSVKPADLFSALGVGSVAIGFAFKDIFQNLLAGILLLLRQPFRIGDEITTGEFTGTVEDIETRATFIRTYDGRRVIIPNGDVYTKPVIVISAYDMLRSEYDVGIGYGDDLAKAKAIALDAIKAVDGVLADPAPDVLVWELGESSKNIRLRWWTKPSRGDVLRIRDAVLKGVAEAIAGAGMDLPFPTQVVLFHDQTEETDGDRTRQREGWPAGKNPPKPRRLAPPEVREDAGKHVE